jgi:hypothetical protein
MLIHAKEVSYFAYEEDLWPRRGEFKSIKLEKAGRNLRKKGRSRLVNLTTGPTDKKRSKL